MSFNSYAFMAFFPITFVVLLIIPKKCRVVWLLAASYYFYTRSSWKFLILLLITTVTTYVFARLMDNETPEIGGGVRAFSEVIVIE